MLAAEPKNFRTVKADQGIFSTQESASVFLLALSSFSNKKGDGGQVRGMSL